MRNEVTELDLRRPEFQDPKLKPEHFEFDADGQVVRKDRFETGMRRVHGLLIEQGLASARDKWTVDSIVFKIKEAMSETQRLKLLIKIIHHAPDEAEYFHFQNMEFVKWVDSADLKQARAEPDNSHNVSFEYQKLKSEGGWEENAAWLEYINVLVSMSDIKSELLTLAGTGAE